MNKYFKIVILVLCFGMLLIGCSNSSKTEQRQDVKESFQSNPVMGSNERVGDSKEISQGVETRVTATKSPKELQNELLKSEVEKVHLQNIQYLLEGNAKKLEVTFSYKGYTEFNEEFSKQKPNKLLNLNLCHKMDMLNFDLLFCKLINWSSVYE